MKSASLDGLNITIFDEIYVQTEGRVPFNVESPPLAFATQTGTGFAKRKETVDTWSGPEWTHKYVEDENGNCVKDERGHYKQEKVHHPKIEGQYLKNEPLSGFTFEKSVSRWSTSNKWFSINDPRGFQLQIAADNLGDILINAGVLNGELQGEYVWARNGSNIFLCRTSHSAYKDFVEPKINRTNLVPGDVILMGQDTTEYEFLGTFYTTRLGYEYRYVEEKTGKIMKNGFLPPYSWTYNRSNYHNKDIIFSTQDDKPVFVFKHSGGLKVMRQKPTKTKILRTGNPSFTLKIGQPYTIWSNLPASSVALFWDTVEEMKEKGPEFIQFYGDTIRSAETLGGYKYSFTGCLYGGDYATDIKNNIYIG
jgi:hypothetical protein